jgi:excinuclease UvrABC ATPase subunit
VWWSSGRSDGLPLRLPSLAYQSEQITHSEELIMPEDLATARHNALKKRIDELEDEVAVMTVVLIGTLTTLRTTTTLSTKHAQITSLLDALAPPESN